MPNFWQPPLEQTFHKAVNDLHEVTKLPSHEECYLDVLRDLSRPDNDKHTLLLRHELQLADHVALLAHARDEPTDTSATCVEEKADGLVIRLACNSAPRPIVTDSIGAMLRELGDELKMGRRRSALCETLFRHTIAIAEERIKQRIRPRRLPQDKNLRPGVKVEPSLSKDPGVKVVEPSLGKDVARLLTELPPDVPSGLQSALRDLSTRLQELDMQVGQAELRPHLAAVIRRCAAISSYRHPHESLASQLKELGGGVDLSKRRNVQQIDKLARYIGLCNDIAWMASRPAYRPLFENITLHLVQTPLPRLPLGAVKDCFVHAEVQIVIDLERNPPAKPRPRAIGSSKSACYLCDMLIREQGKYQVSHAHRTIYHRWTIPDSYWMTPRQQKRFEAIVDAMKAKILARIEEQKGPPKVQPPESRAGYPLSNKSSSSRRSSLLSVRTTASGAGSTPGSPAETPVQFSTENVPLLGEGIHDGLGNEPRDADSTAELPGTQRRARSKTWRSIFSWLKCFSCFGS